MPLSSTGWFQLIDFDSWIFVMGSYQSYKFQSLRGIGLDSFARSPQRSNH
jgi:hypothetical protein